MALKRIDAHISESLADEAEEILQPLASQVWREEGGRHGIVVSGVLGAARSGTAVDALHEEIGNKGRLMVLVSSLDAVLPRHRRISAAMVRGESG